METGIAARPWQEAARTGSADFLLHLHQRSVTWSELWRFYAEDRVSAGSSLALIGFFHAGMSRAYDLEGGVLECDGAMYPQLQEWARFVVSHEDLVPEEALRDSLAGLLAVGLISLLYYEVVFSVYLEARLERQWELCLEAGGGRGQTWATTVPVPRGRLRIRWTERLGNAAVSEDTPWVQSLSNLVEQHYAAWNAACGLALGDEADERHDEGGQG